MQSLGTLKKNAAVLAAVALWIPMVGFGIRTLWQYAGTPGRAATPPAVWPAHTLARPAPGRAFLIIFAHPQCPCSRATIGELAWVMARCREKVEVGVWFYAPAQEPGNWWKTELWRSAAAIPGVRVFEDRDGIEARRFGASTSGQVLLYDSGGHLVFNGGITALRGHSGDNDGRNAIVSLVHGEIPMRQATPVFGCSLSREE
ncbi:MAG TPA: hypothetical protein VNY05_40930 [Candidatus Acidoferrales bacterium]|jgi:hypothetical protein|nr:hypothetical protein [Candidatus Acidoferrales bacterium]